MKFRLGNKEFVVRKCKNDDCQFWYTLSEKNMKRYAEIEWGSWDGDLIRSTFDKNKIWIVEFEGERIAFYDFEFKKDHTFINNI